MGAVWLRVRAEARSRWRAWCGLSLLVGIVGGAAMALAAGARRTDTAYSRFLDEQRAFDVLVVNYEADGTAVYDFDQLARLPEVADSARAWFEYVGVGAVGGTPALADPGNRLGTEINRFKVIRGRLADPRRADEAVVGVQVAEENDLRVGSTIEVAPPELVELVEARDVAALEALLGPVRHEELDAMSRLLDEIPGGRVRVVGIVAAPYEVPPQYQGLLCCVHLTARFAQLSDAFDDNEALAVRLRDGGARLPEFRRSLEELGGGREPQVVVQRDHAAGVERSIGVQASALWLLAGLVAVVGALVLVQLLARLSYTESGDFRTLAALGTTRRQRWGLGAVRAAIVGLVGAAVAVAFAVATSPAFPTGTARIVEPRTGISFDAVVLVAGSIAVVLVTVVLALLPAWLAACIPGSDEEAVPAAPPRLARASAGLWSAPVLAIGTRMALTRGRGKTAVPVGTSLAAVVIGLSVVIGACTFSASLDHLLATPRLHGVSWDLAVWNGGGDAPVAARVAPLAERRRDVVGVATGGFDTQVAVGSHRLALVGYDARLGDVLPPVVEGRAPSNPNEVALGRTTMRELGVAIGDSLTARTLGGSRERLRVVGRAVLPAYGDHIQLGRGGYTNVATLLALDGSPPEEADRAAVLLALAAGTDPDRVLRELRESMCGDDELFCQFFPLGSETPVDIVNFGRVEATPIILAGVLAILAAGTLAHVLVSAVRRRERDLAILKSLGFTRRQLLAAIAVQASTFLGVALALAVPIGIAAGRSVWGLRADALGIVNEPRTPWGTLAVVVAGAFLLANLIAAVPGRIAAGTRPATVLREE